MKARPYRTGLAAVRRRVPRAIRAVTAAARRSVPRAFLAMSAAARRRVACVLLAVLAGAAVAQENAGFEEVGTDGELVGWSLYPARVADGGFHAIVATGDVAEGERCAQLGWYHETELSADEGWLYQDVPAAALRGQRVRLDARATARVTGLPGERARVVLQVWRGGEIVFEDGMLERPLATDRPPDQAEDWTLSDATWQPVTLFADVPADADLVRVALVLRGQGDAWLDAVHLTPVEARAGLLPSAPLSERELANVAAFARLFGYVRFFHPSSEAAAVDWAELAALGVRRVESARDPAELAARLTEVFAPLAPTLRVAPLDAELEVPAELAAPAGFAFVVWTEHRGFGPAGVPYSSALRRERARDGAPPAGAPDPADVFRAELPGGVRCAVPLALWQRRGRTLPAATAALPELDLPRTMHDRSRRLANVVLAWSALRPFFPYFDRVAAGAPADDAGDDRRARDAWDAALETALARAATDIDALELANTLKRLLHPLEDGHAWVRHPDLPQAAPRLAWEWIEGRLLVMRTTGEGDERVVAGEEVLAIDGVPSALAIADAELVVSAATAPALRRAALRELASGPAGSELVLALETPEGARRTVRLRRADEARLEPARPERVAELEPGLWYVDLDRISDEDWADVLEDLAGARGILFDQRVYPRQRPVWGHFTIAPLESPSWEVPMPRRPDEPVTEWDRSRWSLPPLEPHLHAELVVLTSARAQSAAETALSFVEQYELGALVGEATAGTNGNIVQLALPGGFEVSWTGMRVRKQDGSPHHGVGIRPTHPVARTRAGVIAGRDEVLDAGLRVLRERVDR